MVSSGVTLDSTGHRRNSAGFPCGIEQAVFFQGEFCLVLARIRIYAGLTASWHPAWTETAEDPGQFAQDAHSGCQLRAPSSQDVVQAAPRRVHLCSSLPVGIETLSPPLESQPLRHSP